LIKLGDDGLAHGDRAALTVLGDHDRLVQPLDQQCRQVFCRPPAWIGRRLALLEAGVPRGLP
jgi:hypothetical protein